MKYLLPNYAIARLVKPGAIVILLSAVFGCNRQNDSNGPPNVSRSEAPGSGRVDQGGGLTTGQPAKSQPATNVQTNTNNPASRP